MRNPPPNPSTFPNVDSGEKKFQRLLVRQDTLQNWLKNDPILASGEFAYVIGGSTDYCLKIGDSVKPFSQLPWVGGRGTMGPEGPQGPEGQGVCVFGPSDQPPNPDDQPLHDGDVWLASTNAYPGYPSFDAAVASKNIYVQPLRPSDQQIRGTNSVWVQTDFTETSVIKTEAYDAANHLWHVLSGSGGGGSGGPVFTDDVKMAWLKPPIYKAPENSRINLTSIENQHELNAEFLDSILDLYNEVQTENPNRYLRKLGDEMYGRLELRGQGAGELGFTVKDKDADRLLFVTHTAAGTKDRVEYWGPVGFPREITTVAYVQQEIQALINNLTPDLDDLRRRVDELERIVDEHAQLLADLRIDVDALKDAVAQLQKDLAELEVRVTANEGEIQALWKAVQDLESALTKEIQDRIEGDKKLQDQVNHNKDTIDAILEQLEQVASSQITYKWATGLAPRDGECKADRSTYDAITNIVFAAKDVNGKEPDFDIISDGDTVECITTDPNTGDVQAKVFYLVESVDVGGRILTLKFQSGPGTLGPITGATAIFRAFPSFDPSGFVPFPVFEYEIDLIKDALRDCAKLPDDQTFTGKNNFNDVSTFSDTVKFTGSLVAFEGSGNVLSGRAKQNVQFTNRPVAFTSPSGSDELISVYGWSASAQDSRSKNFTIYSSGRISASDSTYARNQPDDYQTKSDVETLLGSHVGTPGAAATIQVGTVNTSTGNAGTNASVSITNAGTSSAARFNFGFTIPRGNTGSKGDKGATGEVKVSTGTETNPSLTTGQLYFNTNSKELYVGS